jgi:hypothetical protein
MKQAVKEHLKINKDKLKNKKPGALFPRRMKPMLKKLSEDTTKTEEQKTKIAKAKTFEELNRSTEVKDRNSEFDSYRFDLELLYRKVDNQWNLSKLTKAQLTMLAKDSDKITKLILAGGK